MPEYIICSTNSNNLGHIEINLCPYFYAPLAQIQVEGVNTMAHIEILNDDDYIDFENETYTLIGRPVVAEQLTGITRYNAPSELKIGTEVWNDDENYPFHVTIQELKMTEPFIIAPNLFLFVIPATNRSMFELHHNGVMTSAEAKAYFEKSSIEITVGWQKFRLKGSSREGLSWEAVPNMMNARFREQGLGIEAQLSELKRFRVRSLTSSIRIVDMSYNFQVLLGFFGFKDYPVEAIRRRYYTGYQTADAPYAAITKFVVLNHDGTEGPVHNWTPEYFFPKQDEGHFVRGVIQYVIETANGFPPRYWLTWEKVTPKPENDWCQIHSQTGTVTVRYLQNLTIGSDNAGCKCRVSIFQGTDQGSPIYVREFAIIVEAANTSVNGQYPVMFPAKKVIVFDEKIRLGLYTNSGNQTNGYWVKEWVMTPASQNLFKFCLGQTPEGNGNDDGRTVMIQALHNVGKGWINATVEYENGWIRRYGLEYYLRVSLYEDS